MNELHNARPGEQTNSQQSVNTRSSLMLTNPRDAFRGQSRSPNIVPFHMLDILSSRPIVTLSLRQITGFSHIRLQKMS